MSHIDLDVIERDVDHARSTADYFGLADDGSVSVRLADATVLALVRAVRAAIRVAFVDDFMTPAGLVAEKELRQALAPFRKEAT